MERCMICVEDCDTYILTSICSCKMISHEICFRKWLDERKICMICKKEIKNVKNDKDNKHKQTKIDRMLNDTFTMRCFSKVMHLVTEWVNHCTYIITHEDYKTHFFLKLSIILIMSSIFFIFFVVPLLSLLEVNLSIIKIKMTLIPFMPFRKDEEEEEEEEKDFYVYNL